MSKAPVKFPATNTDVLENLSEYLLDYEKKEIMDYPTVYYLNLVERKKEGGMPKQDGKTNHGWSKDNG